MIKSSDKSKRTCNPIRNIVDNLKPPANHPKSLINLALGDPTIHGNLQCPKLLNTAVHEKLFDHTANSYLPAVGLTAARKAIAERNFREGFVVNPDDVVIASGCSGALELVLTALVDEGDNVLVPKPCFPLYQVIVDSLGGKVKHYGLKPEASWECDLEEMDRLVDERTRAIVINNPSNPCGSNFSAEHLAGIAAVARKHGLPIVADEIYGGVVFKGQFEPIHVHSGDVPVLSVGGLAKEFIIPGWRVGWVIIHDKNTGRLNEVKQGIRNLSQIVLGANSLIQAAIPRLLCPERGSADETIITEFLDRYMGILRTNADVCVRAAANCGGIKVIEPSGAMYMMVHIDVDAMEGVKDDADFARQLLVEENLYVLPGQCFTMPNYIRMVICPPSEVLEDAFRRLYSFCERRKKVKTVA